MEVARELQDLESDVSRILSRDSPFERQNQISRFPIGAKKNVLTCLLVPWCPGGGGHKRMQRRQSGALPTLQKEESGRIQESCCFPDLPSHSLFPCQRQEINHKIKLLIMLYITADKNKPYFDTKQIFSPHSLSPHAKFCKINSSLCEWYCKTCFST